LFFSFVNEIKKILLSMLFSFIIIMIFEMLIKIPEKLEEDLNDVLKTKDKSDILDEQ